MRIWAPLLMITAMASATSAQTSFPSPAHLRAEHPRLLVLDDQMTAVRSAIGSDPVAKAMHDLLVGEANKLLDAPPSTYSIDGAEKVLLATSRKVEGRVMLLAGLYRLDHDKRYADRAITEMRAAAAFPDWYPKHFLDTAEMTAALGIGYDWCFDSMSPDDRALIRRAIVDKGLDPGIARMQPGESFSKLHNNWVQVCYGGLTLGALSIAEDEPQRAHEVIAHSIPAMTEIMKLFAPDGGFEEGPTYWNYATTFNTYYIAALDSALGTDFGLADSKGYADTGDYRMQTIGPLRTFANFGDCHPHISFAPQMFWMSRKFNRPMYARHERDLDTHPESVEKIPPILELLWQYPRAAADPAITTPLAAHFERISEALMRTAWDDPFAGYLAFKGGDARASHGHLDLGHFICEIAGQRWAVDEGPESYGVPGYFSTKRWDYFRTRTEAHNTLTIDDTNESRSARAPLTQFRMGQGDAAIADLSECYPESFRHWQRGTALPDANHILIQDEFEPTHSVHVIWHFHTFATVKITNKLADLSQGNARVHMRLVSPDNAIFTVRDESTPPAPNSPNPKLLDIQIDLGSLDQPTTIAVQLSNGDEPPMPVLPLRNWQLSKTSVP